VIHLFNQDCLPAMKDYPDKSFELAIVDPPYGINRPNMNMGSMPNRMEISTAERLKKGRLNQGAGKLKNRNIQIMPIKWDYEKPSPEYFEELRRVSEDQIIFGGNYFDLGPSRCVICWDKVQPWDNFSQWEMMWTSFDRPASIFKYANFGHCKIHPTQKPAALYRWLLKNYAKQGYKILDTHSGSLSIGIACHDMGFDLWAYELDEDYFKAGKERLERHQLQGRLF
jgi:site-specific DNA-methyltransferase (adenine-specific)